jgi:hypothetical protein
MGMDFYAGLKKKMRYKKQGYSHDYEGPPEIS